MTQRQVPHDFELPRCAADHPVRHIHDARAMHAGGGHFLECQCRRTTKAETFDIALAEWCRLNDKRKPRIPRAGAVLQFPLQLPKGAPL